MVEEHAKKYIKVVSKNMVEYSACNLHQVPYYNKSLTKKIIYVCLLRAAGIVVVNTGQPSDESSEMPHPIHMHREYLMELKNLHKTRRINNQLG